MPPRPSNTTRELLTLYARAGHDEHNIGAFFRDHPDLAAGLGVHDLERDDADLALQLAPTIGKYKRRLALEQAGERVAQAQRAARELASSARHRLDGVELEPALLFGELLADSSKKYIAFELTGRRVSSPRHLLLRTRVALRPFLDVTAHIDERGLHLAWRHGRGGLNLRPHPEERGAAVLVVDLRAPAPRISKARRTGPVPIAEVLAGLGFF